MRALCRKPPSGFEVAVVVVSRGRQILAHLFAAFVIAMTILL